MDEQQAHALRELALCVRNLGLVETRRALAICAEESNEAEDGTDLAHRLLDRANGATDDALVNVLAEAEKPPRADEAVMPADPAAAVPPKRTSKPRTAPAAE